MGFGTFPFPSESLEGNRDVKEKQWHTLGAWICTRQLPPACPKGGETESGHSAVVWDEALCDGPGGSKGGISLMAWWCENQRRPHCERQPAHSLPSSFQKCRFLRHRIEKCSNPSPNPCEGPVSTSYAVHHAPRLQSKSKKPLCTRHSHPVCNKVPFIYSLLATVSPK